MLKLNTGRSVHPSLPVSALASVVAAAVGLVGLTVPTVAAAPDVPAGCVTYVPRETEDGASSPSGSPSGSVSGGNGAGTTPTQDAPGALECQVPSPSMGRDFSVIVRPSLTPANEKVALFLDGADSGEVNGWVEKAGAVNKLTDVDKTLVFPVTDPWTWSQNWDGGEEASDARFETFLADELPDYLESSFGVPDGGRGTTGVVGLSAGAYATLNLATKYPEQYSSVYALSGVYDPQSAGGRFAIDTTSTHLSGRGTTPWKSEASRAANNPMRNLGNLTMPAIVNVSTGIVHPEELAGKDPVAAYLVGGPVETGTFVMTAQLQVEAMRLGMDNIDFRYDILGGHTWPTWRRAAFDNGTIRTFLDRI
ncbi:alpha/beta hydrolase-fold protein [Corynebacterium sp.]|jgi:diacylglycerol O-acyltransferase/trehalose O-mycolyltransferase|uniref:alpha/beta hydrolase-fold protein n=1 Tax=Corynebacterium sp. TaxID=1720 RepID=UPI0025BB1015|nr:alpha/beta hydrolase-fold protein [Corynebacterium sp.]